MPPLFESRRRQVADRVRQLLTGVADGSDSPEAPRHQSDAPDWVLPRAVALHDDSTRRAAMAVGVAVVLVAVITAIWVLAGRPRSDALRPDTPVASSAGVRAGPTSAATRPSSAAAVVVVDVVGKVRRPGVYRLPVGSRIDDAVRAAGGFSGSVTGAAVNLAARLSDGQQVLVGVAAAPGAAVAGGAPSSGGGTGDGAGTAGAPVNLNSATSGDLEALPGVGPVLAQHIVDWRTAHGSFTSVDQLRSVSGIGPSKYATLRPLVAV